MKSAFIYSGKRTAIGSFMGALSSVPAPQLGATAARSALTAGGRKPEEVQSVIVGSVLPAGMGQAPARQVCLFSKIPNSSPALTINKVCGSGLKAVTLASDQVVLGKADLILAGGIENMSMVPYYVQNARSGFRMGNQQMIDGMVWDGLWDVYNQYHMGNAAELCVKEYKMSREEQDKYSVESYERAQKASNSGLFKEEIAPVEIKQKKETILFDKDEEPFKSDLAKLPGLRPAFDAQGSVTAGNASSINDGAAMLLVGKEGLTGQKPIARILHTAEFAQAPEWFTTAPVGCIKKLLSEASVSVSDISVFEINEAFAAVAMAAQKELNIPREKLNPRGGAVALGHPIGASGARILITLLHQLQSGQKGVASLCIGGGEAIAVLVEKL